MQQTTQQYIQEIRQKIEKGKTHPHIVESKENKFFQLYEESYHIDLTLLTDLMKKQTHTKTISYNPFLPPFDDGKFVMDLGSQHRLLFNKFPVQLGHVLICTKQFEMQHAPLSFEDIRQTLAVTKALNGIYFFNAGKSAGTSQPHRHIQCLPQQSKRSPIGQLLQKQAQAKKESKQTGVAARFQLFDFQHKIIYFEEYGDFEKQARQMYQEYTQFHKDMIEVGNQKYVCYSLIGTPNYMMMIPRRSEYMFGKIGQNSIAFLGYIRTQVEDDFNVLTNKQPKEMFAELTFANQEQLDKFKEELAK